MKFGLYLLVCFLSGVVMGGVSHGWEPIVVLAVTNGIMWSFAVE